MLLASYSTIKELEGERTLSFARKLLLKDQRYTAVVLRGRISSHCYCCALDQGSAGHEALLDCELGEEMLNGEAKVADLWSVYSAEEAVGKFG